MIRSIDSNQPTKRNNTHLMLTSAAGAALGAGARYVLPAKNAADSAVKTSVKNYFSSNALNARGANRSILKYGALGALIAGGLYLITKAFNAKKEQMQKYDDIYEFSKYQALIEAPDIACEMIFYED